MPDKKKTWRTQVDLAGLEGLVEDSRNTTEWKNTALGGKVRILAAERILIDIGRKNPADVTDELLETLDITRERAEELLNQ